MWITNESIWNGNDPNTLVDSYRKAQVTMRSFKSRYEVIFIEFSINEISQNM